MATDARNLIDRSIDNLQQLATELGADLEVARPLPEKTPLDLRRKEALLTISILLPKLAAVRDLQPAQRRSSEAVGARALEARVRGTSISS